jgi:hypothetical protein
VLQGAAPNPYRHHLRLLLNVLWWSQVCLKLPKQAWQLLLPGLRVRPAWAQLLMAVILQLALLLSRPGLGGWPQAQAPEQHPSERPLQRLHSQASRLPRAGAAAAESVALWLAGEAARLPVAAAVGS